MNDRRWGFEGLDDGEYEEITRRRPAKEPVETTELTELTTDRPPCCAGSASSQRGERIIE